MTERNLRTWNQLALFSCIVVGIAAAFVVLVNRAEQATATHPYDNILKAFSEPRWRASTAIDVLSHEHAISTLGLSPDAVKQVHALTQEAKDGSSLLWQEWRKEHTEATIRPFAPDGLGTLMVKKHRAILNHLSSEQKRRLDQLVWRHMGWHFVFEPKAAAEMALTAKQQFRFKDLFVERTAINSRYARAWRDGDEETRAEARSRYEIERQELDASFMAILTSAQRATRLKLLGPSMRVDSAE